MSALGGSADMRFALHMSAFDPKRTFNPKTSNQNQSRRKANVAPVVPPAKSAMICEVSVALEDIHEATGVFDGARRWCRSLAGPWSCTANPDPKACRVHSQFAATAGQRFRETLQKLGWVEGDNLVIEFRYGEGRDDRFPEFAAELVSMPVDVLVVWGTPPHLPPSVPLPRFRF